MTGAVFLTGGTGFVGRRLIAKLAATGRSDVRLLTRSTPLPNSIPGGWRVVPGDLARPDSYAAALAGSETVVHLAARTGKASRKLHFEAGLTATTNLLKAARDANVKRFLFVSSIAAGYPDQRHYHYAQAKARAETAVRESGLDSLIVRPTMVLGPGSPVLANLRRLATLPIPVMFGKGRPVQPIHVDDLADTLTAAIDNGPWDGRTVELGGPTVVDFEPLLQRIRGGSARRFLKIPIEPTRTVLALLEPLLLPVLPFTAGQLAAFANPATARADNRPPKWPPPFRDVDAMLAIAPSAEGEGLK